MSSNDFLLVNFQPWDSLELELLNELEPEIIIAPES